jgi:hypothetical protein
MRVWMWSSLRLGTLSCSSPSDFVQKLIGDGVVSGDGVRFPWGGFSAVPWFDHE